MLVMVILISRLPWLERVVGQDRLVAWHRRIGGWPIALIAVHIGLITWGYAQMTSVSILHQFWTFIIHYPDILASVLAFGLLVMAGLTSARVARQRMKYETWWMVHLYIYLALSLAFAHQIRTGVMFIGHPLIRDVWILMWIAGAGAVLGFRVILPVSRNLRHQLRVAQSSKRRPASIRSSFLVAICHVSTFRAVSSSCGGFMSKGLGRIRIPTRSRHFHDLHSFA